MIKSSWTDALVRMRARIAGTADTVHDGFPHFADPATGRWTLTPNGDWIGGYWNGMLWLSAYSVGAEHYTCIAALLEGV